MARRLSARKVHINPAPHFGMEEVYISETRRFDTEEVHAVAERRFDADEVYLSATPRLSATKIYISGSDPGAFVGQAAEGGCVPFSQVDGVVPVSTTFEHPADFALGYTLTALSGGNQDIRVRIQDATNYILIRTNNVGNLSLAAIVNGSFVGTLVANGVLSAGHRIVVVAVGSNIKVYSNDVLRHNGTFTQFVTETDGILQSLTSAVVRDLKVWGPSCVPSGIEPT